MKTSPISVCRLEGDQRDSGFTLVELALALGIASVALISVFVLLQTGFKTYGDAMSASVTSGIAQEVISQYLLADFDQLAGRPAEMRVTNYYDERGVMLDAFRAERAVYQSVSRVLPASVQSIDRSKLLPCQVAITSPMQPSLNKVYTFFIARQGEGAP